MNILDLIAADGGTLRKVATTHGGEYAGSCPWCGGRDRFRVWPGTGRFWCRGCGKAGDSIEWLRKRRGLTFAEACRTLGREPGPRKEQPRTAPAAWTPKEATAPGALWQTKARVFLDGAVDHLWSAEGEPIRAWLRTEKGLHDATIRAAGLGLNLADKSEPRAAWGLEIQHKEDGTEKMQWLPGGLVIPLIVGGAVHRLRIRRSNPGDGARYVVASGSSSSPTTWNMDRAAAVIVESELDGLLLNQEAGDLSGVVALGTATAKPDTATHAALKAAAVVLVALDSDEAGARAAWRFWPDTYGTKARRWPTVQGKDASAARLNGLDLRAWVVAGLFGTEERFERFCIQTIDGGMTDHEAINMED
ncbi:MAG TPA: CHC2 zinc finger domain-containing protein [Syntrophales bacterium]|nr:CHC2 zinc finger domain-containing protein [Syntrophales bacterium]